MRNRGVTEALALIESVKDNKQFAARLKEIQERESKFLDTLKIADTIAKARAIKSEMEREMAVWAAAAQREQDALAKRRDELEANAAKAAKEQAEKHAKAMLEFANSKKQMAEAEEMRREAEYLRIDAQRIEEVVAQQRAEVITRENALQVKMRRLREAMED